MKAGDLVATSGRALRANPLRSALTALGVIIGVAAVVAMVALASGARAKVQSGFSSLGSNLIVVFPGAASQGGFRFGAGSANSLKIADAEAIAREVSGAAAVAPVQRSGGQVVAEGVNWNTQIFGVTGAYLDARDLEIDSGRFIDDRENAQARKVAVLGKTVVDKLFPNSDPVGQRIRINKTIFDVVGVLKSKGQSGFGQDQDDVVVAPLLTVKRRISGRGNGTNNADSVSTIYVKAATEGEIASVQSDITELMRQRHKIQPGAEDDFNVQNLQSIAEQAQAAMSTITNLMLGVAAVSLLVGGIGIMNIMLVSVTERTREIGLRKALGAKRTDILHQFGLEAVTLSVAGGVVGLMLGTLMAWGLTAVMQLPLVLGWEAAVTAIVVAAGVGVIFGSYPAWQAARLDPIEALRRQ